MYKNMHKSNASVLRQLMKFVLTIETLNKMNESLDYVDHQIEKYPAFEYFSN